MAWSLVLRYMSPSARVAAGEVTSRFTSSPSSTTWGLRGGAGRGRVGRGAHWVRGVRVQISQPMPAHASPPAARCQSLRHSMWLPLGGPVHIASRQPPFPPR